MRRIKLKAHVILKARVILFSIANILVPGGMPFGLVDHPPEAQDS